MSTRNKQRGQGMIEYIIVVAAIAIAGTILFTSIKDAIDAKGQEAIQTIQEVGS